MPRAPCGLAQKRRPSKLVARAGRPEIAPVERIRSVAHQQQLTRAERHAALPPGQDPPRAFEPAAFDDGLPVDADDGADRADGIARDRRDALHQRHVGGEIMAACGEHPRPGGHPGDSHVAGGERRAGGDPGEPDRGARRSVPDEARGRRTRDRRGQRDRRRGGGRDAQAGASPPARGAPAVEIVTPGEQRQVAALSQPCRPPRARLRPGIDIVDMVAPGPPVHPAQGAGAACAHRLQGGERQAEMERSLFGGEERAGFARRLRAPRGVVHRSGSGLAAAGMRRVGPGLARSGLGRQGRKRTPAIRTPLTPPVERIGSRARRAGTGAAVVSRSGSR